MLKTFKYRIYPNRKQRKHLIVMLESSRLLYNQLLAQRKDLYEKEKKSLSYYDQAKYITQLKKENKNLKNIHSQVLQNIAIRIDLAYKAFFRRIKSGETPGFPRFKSFNRYDSITYPQSGFELFENKEVVKISKIGEIKVVYHRDLLGKIKTCTIKKTPTDKWYVSFTTEIEPSRLPMNEEQIGIDVGLEKFAMLSNGERIENPRFFRKEESELVKVQQKLSATDKNSKERIHRRKIVARVHERISNKRSNFCHQESRKIVDRFGTICIEDLNINSMIQSNNDDPIEARGRGKNKSIQDAAWKLFLGLIFFKAEEAGRKLIKVNPAYTSQICNRCGYRQHKELKERIHRCVECGYEVDRDLNAAMNILRLGTQSLKPSALC